MRTQENITNNFKSPIMIRKRYIPNEEIDISSDKLLYRDDNLLITKWKVIHPRSDFKTGLSFILINEGIKISKFYKGDGSLYKIYCDIIETKYIQKQDKYIFVDLLLDVTISPNNKVEVLDEDELQEALDKKLITKHQAEYSIKTKNKLLNMINTNNFPPKIISDKWSEYDD